jgi:putative proteasome-type protease
MTYCVAIKINDGLVFASDTRTSAGVDDVRSHAKQHSFELPGERVFVILSSGNLATTQSVVNAVARDWNTSDAQVGLRVVRHMYDAAEYVGGLVVRAQRDSAQQGQFSNVDFRATLILGGQILGEEPVLYLIYPEGNCIATSPETPYLQVGETKYGKPILDRIIRPTTGMEEAARCALVSLDSTMKSNLSVGPPLDVSMVPRDALRITRQIRLDYDTPYYAALKKAWGESLERVFRELPRFDWEQAPEQQALQLQQQR